MFSFQKRLIQNPLTYNLCRQFSKETKEGPQKFFVLSYQFVQDMHFKRIPYKEDHLKKVAKLEKDGALVFGGALFPNTGAFMIFNCDDQNIPKNFVNNDPYYVNGLVTEYKIDEINKETKKEFAELARKYSYNR